MNNRKIMTTVLAAPALAFVFTIGAMAITRAPANIPFDFEHRGQVMPAGRYTFELSYGTGLFSMTDSEGRQYAGLGTPLGNPNVIGGSKIVFHFDGQAYHLAEIWLKGSGGKKVNYKPLVPAMTSKAQPPKRIEIAIPG